MERREAIAEALKRIVDVIHPEEVYLFGSTARGDDRPDSDVDFLVVVSDNVPRKLLFGGEIYDRLGGLPFPVDVSVWRRSSFEERRDWLMSLPAIALREGKLVYDAGPKAA